MKGVRKSVFPEPNPLTSVLNDAALIKGLKFLSTTVYPYE